MDVIELTDLGGSFGLPVIGNPGRKQQMSKLFKGVRYPANAPLSMLNAVGLFEFQNKNFDTKNLRSTGSSDALNGALVLRTHTTTFAAIATIKDRRSREIRALASTVYNGGTTALGKPVYTDHVKVVGYNAIAGAVALGTAWPGGGVPIFDMTGTKFNTTLAQFSTMMDGIATH